MAEAPGSGQGSDSDEEGSSSDYNHRAGNQIAIPNTNSDVAPQSGENEGHDTQLEYTFTGGDYRGASLGPKTSKKYFEARRYDNPVITEFHYHINKRDHSEEPSTSGSQEPKKRRIDSSQIEEGYRQISEDTMICTKEPLRKGTKIYKGIQVHVCGKMPVAIKRIVDCTDADVKEVETLVKVADHPNVIRIIQSRESIGEVRVLYIVMELCSCKNLQDYMEENRKKKTPFNHKKTMSFSLQLVSGMKHIHANRIIHRDLKPENILLSQDEAQVKIGDFGLGKELSVGHSITKVSTPGQGTMGYRAPETLQSNEVSQRADIFSLGLTLFGLWSDGKHPFGDDLLLRDYNIMNNKGRDLSGLLISDFKREEFVDLIDRMLQFDPRLRPTIEQVAQDPFFTNEMPQAHQQEPNVGGRSSHISQQEPGSGHSALAGNEHTHAHTSQAAASTEGASMDRTFFSPEEEASRLLKEHKFEEAIPLLRRLQPRKRQQKMLAECYLRVGRDTEAHNCINTLKDILTSSQDNPKPDDVIESIAEDVDRSQFLQALILIPSASELAKIDSSPDDALWQLVLCTWRCSDVVSGLYNQGARMRVIAKSVATEIMLGILSTLRSITNADPDRKVDMEARCLNDIAIAFHDMEQYNKGVQWFRKGIENMKMHFGEKATKYSVLLRLYLNLGASLCKLGKHNESEKCLAESERLLGTAEDYPTEDDKKRAQECTVAKMKKLRHEMIQARSVF